MSLNQYAVYQLKPDASTRPLRYKSYNFVLENNPILVREVNLSEILVPSIEGIDFCVRLCFHKLFLYKC